MEIEGKIIVVCPPREGTTSRGAWKSQDYVIETHDQFPRRCCFNVFGIERIQQFNIQSGEEVRVSFDLDAHEYQGRWFHSIRAWHVERITAGHDPHAPHATATTPPPAPFPQQPSDGEDDLPF